LILKEYFELSTTAVAKVGDEIANSNRFAPDDVLISGNVSHQRKIRKVEDSWSLSLRLAIIDHLITFDINLSLLIGVVETCRFDLGIEDLVEIVRAMDILGAETRLKEYEALLYLEFRKSTKNANETESSRFTNRLPVNFFAHVRRFGKYQSSSEIIGSVGSQRLIEYFINTYKDEAKKDAIFIELCYNGHLSTAQWLYSLGDVNIHAEEEGAFRLACSNDGLLVAQWLYSLGDVDIHIIDNEVFLEACLRGHLSVAQWLYGLDNGIDIHGDEEFVFRGACYNGHLSIVQWIYSLGGTNIHADSDFAFRFACREGRLIVAQWLYHLGNINIHAKFDEAFYFACQNHHLLVAQWLYSLDNSFLELPLDDSKLDSKILSWLRSIRTT
jgi:hypothetical protein